MTFHQLLRDHVTCQGFWVSCQEYGFVLPAFRPSYSRFIAQYRQLLSDPATGRGAMGGIRLSCHAGRTFIVFGILLARNGGLAMVRATFKVE